MKRFAAVVLLCIFSLALISCGSQSTSNPGADVSGNWNVLLTETGQTAPSYAFGLNLTKNTTTITGSEITYTGGTQFNTGCVNYGHLTVTGNSTGGSAITLVVADSSTNSTFTISGDAVSGVTQINGNFAATFGPNGSNPACPNTNGSAVLTRQ